MRKAFKNLISLSVLLIAGLNFIVPAFAQDPFTAIAVGGLSGASGAGLFSSMSMASGVTYDWSNGSDPLDAMYNVTNPDYVLFHGKKHEATNIDEDIYDYIQVDIGDWLEAQSDFIVDNITRNNIQENSSGNLTDNTLFYHGVPNNTTASLTVGEGVSGTLPGGIMYTCQKYSSWYNISLTMSSGRTGTFSVDGTGSFVLQVLYVLTSSNPGLTLRFSKDGVVIANPQFYEPITNGYSVGYSSGSIDTHVFDGWESAKVKIPTSVSQLQPGWTPIDFFNELNRIWSGAGEDNIIIENGSDDPPVPPQPIPDTPLGNVPFDDWVDLWGQSIWEQLTRLEEKQELMVIGQDDGLESLEDLQGIGHDALEDFDDLIGLETNINENLEDMITYEQGISNDVESIDENVEDIEDEVIVIVDDMGNVIDVLEGIDAKAYAQGQKLGEISTEVGTIGQTIEAISTEVEAQTETQEDIKEAVEDMVPYVAPIPDIATDTETMVDILPDIATATQTSTQTLTDTLPDIKDATQTITDTLPDIITEIQDATTTLTDDIPNIDDICENIDEAPYKDLDTGLDRLPRFLLPYITDLRSALGIWHYVTEWLAQISTTFAFISGCLVGTSIMTPIYATIAGFMCIKIYRRMTT